jgi:type I restriction enzyme, S subunit
VEDQLRPYEAYKQTGYDWLEHVPDHWEVKTIRSITKLSSERNGTRNDLELLSVYREYGVIRKSSRDDNHNVESQDLSNYKVVDESYLVLNKMKMWQGSLGVSKYKGIVSPAYIVCKLVSDLNFAYIHYLLRSAEFKTIYNRISYGVRVGQWDMRYDDFKNINLFLPPISEQDQIVRYLDWKLGKINLLIRAKKRQIGLLKEKIDSMTNHAISVEDIDKKRLVNVSKRIGKWIEREKAQEYIPIGLLNKGRGIFHKSAILGSDLGDSEFFQVEDNALIFSGQFAWEGAVALTERKDEKCIASHRYYMISGIEGVAKNEYLWALFRTKYGHLLLNLNSRGAAGRNRPLNMNSLLKEYIPLPPIEVQEEISKSVRLLLRFVKAINQLEELLTEYRTRLISDVVTGKVDVRGIIVEDIQNKDITIDDLIEEELEVDEEVLEEVEI